MHKFSVDKDKCVSCGLCVKDCLFSILELENGSPVFTQPEKCIGCLHCYAICPVGAISMDDHDPAKALPMQKIPTSEEVGAFIRQRRSIRQFKQENIGHAEMRGLLEMAWNAPSGVNQHLLQIAVIDDIVEMDAFRKYLYGEIEKIYQAGALDARLLAFMGPNPSEWLKNDVLFRGAPHLVAVASAKNAATGIPDCFIYLSCLEMLACAAGFGTLWCGLVYRLLKAMPQAEKFLGIQDGYETGYVMLLGKPAVHYARGFERGKANIHIVNGPKQEAKA